MVEASISQPRLPDPPLLDRWGIDLATTMQSDELVPKAIKVALLALALLSIVLAPLALAIVYKSLTVRMPPSGEDASEEKIAFAAQTNLNLPTKRDSSQKEISSGAVEAFIVKPAVVLAPPPVPLKNFGAIANICWANAIFQVIVASPRLSALIEKGLKAGGNEAAFCEAVQAYRARQSGAAAEMVDLGEKFIPAYLRPNTGARKGQGGVPNDLYRILLAGGEKIVRQENMDKYVCSPKLVGQYYWQLRGLVGELPPIVDSEGLASEIWKDGLTADQYRTPPENLAAEIEECSDWYQPEVILGRCNDPSGRIIEDFHTPGQKAAKYKLVSVICASFGRDGTGHYWAVVRSENSDGTVRYAECNDSRITTLTQEQFQQEVLQKSCGWGCYERVD